MRGTDNMYLEVKEVEIVQPKSPNSSPQLIILVGQARYGWERWRDTALQAVGTAHVKTNKNPWEGLGCAPPERSLPGEKVWWGQSDKNVAWHKSCHLL